MHVRTDNRGHPHQDVRFPVAPVTGRNLLTPGHLGVRVRNVRKIFKLNLVKVYAFVVFFPEFLSGNFGHSYLWQLMAILGRISMRLQHSIAKPLYSGPYRCCRWG